MANDKPAGEVDSYGAAIEKEDNPNKASGKVDAPGQAEDKIKGKSAEEHGKTTAPGQEDKEEKLKPTRGVGRGGKGKGSTKGKGLNKEDE